MAEPDATVTSRGVPWRTVAAGVLAGLLVFLIVRLLGGKRAV